MLFAPTFIHPVTLTVSQELSFSAQTWKTGPSSSVSLFGQFRATFSTSRKCRVLTHYYNFWLPGFGSQRKKYGHTYLILFQYHICYVMYVHIQHSCNSML